MKDGANIDILVNGARREVNAAPGRRLSDVLRNDLGLTGTKVGCDAGDCGACSVLLDGEVVCACLTPVAHVGARAVETVEALGEPGPDALQRAFLRHGAAQCGICTPGMLMAATALIRRTQTSSRSEVEEALAGVLCRCTGYTKIVDAVMDVAADKAGPSPKRGAAIGVSVERLDGLPKVDGTELYGADEGPRDALWVRAIRSPHARASFAFGDLENWASDREVIVFKASDIEGQNSFSVIRAYADQPALAEKEVRMRGEAVALVAGEQDVMSDLDLADFPISWEVLNALTTVAEACKEDAPRVLEDRPDNLLIAGHVKRGDPLDALAGSAHVVERTMDTGYVEHAYIEPEAGLAWMDGDVLNIRACTQAPVMDRDETALILGLEAQQVRIRPAATGGGFGSKLDVSLQPLIGLVTLKTGRAARMVYTRRESMMSTTKRHPSQMSARIGTDAEGRLTGMWFDGDFNTGAYSSWGPTVAVRVPVHASGPYAVPHYRAKARAVHTNGPVSGAFRGFGVPQAAILQETLFDELAEAAGLDRLAFRRKNALMDGQASVCGQVLQGVGIGECLDALSPVWDAGLEAVAQHNATHRDVKRGLGVASCWYGCGNTALPNPSTVRIGVTSDGTIVLHQGAMDIGQGANTVIAQIAADAFGIPVHQLTLVDGDTDITPDCGKTSASRQTVVTGKAAMLSGQALRAQVLAMTNMGSEAELTFEGTQIVVRDGDHCARIALESLPEGAHGYVLQAEESYDPPTSALDENGQGTPYAVYGYGAQMAEVEVDMKLGTVRVIRIIAAHDLGRVINPLLAEGQIEGGIAQGLGLALMEEYIPGRTENLHDYLIPTIGDMPEIKSILIEKPDPEGPYGAKGLGEHVLIPTAPAILNAIRHASGAQITKLPARPDRVLAAIKEAGNDHER
ncbi:molybdopterin cofactor-binding domain-containing protein [Shimia sp.]|uniref:molybdopterin-dependent oxidoreductase n=1 Tax=Shimia sp. TaxID=1954381 RepID=UPI003298BA7E